MLYPLTGGAAAEGRELRAGAELTAEIANNKMPIDMTMAKRGAITSLEAAGPDVMLFAGYGSDAVLMVKTLKAQRVSAKIVWGQDAGFESPEFRTELGDDVVGILTRTVFGPGVAEVKNVSGQVNAIYRTKVGTNWDRASSANIKRTRQATPCSKSSILSMSPRQI